MPRFYGDSMDTIFYQQSGFEDAMRITNHSPNSENADYGSNHIDDYVIDQYLVFSDEDGEETVEQ